MRKALCALTLTLATTLLGADPAMAGCTTDCYGATAGGMWNDWNGGAHVAIGASWDHDTQKKANSAAIKQCRVNGRNCKIQNTFSHGGCGYITVGETSDGVRMTAGSDSTEVYNRCMSRGGYNCKTPIGGCTGR